MTAPLELINGNSSTPSIAFASDPTTGFYRSASGVVGVAGALSATGSLNGTTIYQNNLRLIPIGLGPLPWAGIAAPSGWVLAGNTYSRSTYADLWAFAQAEIAAGNTFWGAGNGSTTFTSAVMNGILPVGVDAAASRISGITHVGDATGSATHSVTLAELPTGITVATSGAITVSSTRQIPSTLGSVTSYNPGNGGAAQAGTPGTTAGGAGDWAAISSMSSSGAITSTSNNTSGTAMSLVQPIRAFNFIIFAGA